MKTHHVMFVSLAFAAVVACAQEPASVAVAPQGFTWSEQFFAPRFASRPMTGAPYSAESISESEQTLADGTHIRNSSPATKFYRDSEGRTRTERPVLPQVEGSVAASPVLVEINDPVAHARYILDTVNKVAHRQEPPVPGTQAHSRGGTADVRAVTPLSASQAQGRAGGPESTTEKLGTQVMEGVQVEGTRHTITWPAGARGNDRPITEINETWRSPELMLIVLSRRTDPATGERTTRLTNISRSEPDAALFQPPPDFSVVDEAGDFTIQWSR